MEATTSIVNQLTLAANRYLNFLNACFLYGLCFMFYDRRLFTIWTILLTRAIWVEANSPIYVSKRRCDAATRQTSGPEKWTRVGRTSSAVKCFNYMCARNAVQFSGDLWGRRLNINYCALCGGGEMHGMTEWASQKWLGEKRGTRSC